MSRFVITPEELASLLDWMRREHGKQFQAQDVVPDDAPGWADLIDLQARRQRTSLIGQLDDIEVGKWYAVRLTRRQARQAPDLFVRPPGTPVRTEMDVVPLDGGRLPEGDLG